jgi:hypothetical protein
VRFGFLEPVLAQYGGRNFVTAAAPPLPSDIASLTVPVYVSMNDVDWVSDGGVSFQYFDAPPTDRCVRGCLDRGACYQDTDFVTDRFMSVFKCDCRAPFSGPDCGTGG